jgi:hypothetical protein
MEKFESFKEWMQNKSYIILFVLISIQCVISAIFLVLYFVEANKDITLVFKIYSCSLLVIFTIYEVHFAHHSINRAYPIELLAFLLMGTMSTSILVFFYVQYILLVDETNTVSFNNNFNIFLIKNLNFRCYFLLELYFVL